MFFLSEVRSFLKRKILDLAFLDSVQRAAYKDLVALLDEGSLLTDKEKIAKCEDSFRKISEKFQDFDFRYSHPGYSDRILILGLQFG